MSDGAGGGVPLADGGFREESDAHLPAEVAALALVLLLGSICAQKWVQLTRIQQENWVHTNAATRARSRKALHALLGHGAAAREANRREADSLAWSRREVAKALFPEVLAAISTAAFYAVRPHDISSLEVSVSGGMERFYAVALLGILLLFLLEQISLWQFLQQQLSFGCLRYILQMQRCVLPVLAGRARSGSAVGGALALVDIFWMWSVTTASIPFFCSYQTTPPRLLAADISCWDNKWHWYLVFLSGCGLMGIFTWSLSMVIRKCNWPTDTYWHQFEGVFERANGGVDGLRFQVVEGGSHQHSVLLSLRRRMPLVSEGILDQLYWLYDPWDDSDSECKVLPPVEEFPPAFRVLLRGRQPATPPPSPRPGAAPPLGEWPAGGPRAPLLEVGGGAAEEEVELTIEALDGEGSAGRCGLRVRRSGATGGPALAPEPWPEPGPEPPQPEEGEWRRVAFLKTPHAVEPHPYFAMTVAKVVATLAWSSYVPPHTSEAWRACIVAVLVGCALSTAAIAHHCRPFALDCVNALMVFGMLAAAGVSSFSLLLTSVLPTGAAFVMLVSWAMTWAAIMALFLAALHILHWLLEGSPFYACLQTVPLSTMESAMEPLCKAVESRLPVWSVHVGEAGKEISPFPVSRWHDAYQSMTEFYGHGLQPSQILTEHLGPVRIVEVGLSKQPSGAAPEPLGGDGQRCRWIAYEAWAQDPKNRRGILSRVLCVGAEALALADVEAGEWSYGDRVRVVRESYSLLDLTAIARSLCREEGGCERAAGRTRRLNLMDEGQRLQDVPLGVPRVLPVGICGSGKSTLLSALGGLSLANGAFLVEEEATAGGVTVDTTALLADGRRLLIDMPGLGDSSRNHIQDLSNTKKKLAGYPSDDGARAISAEDRAKLFVNHFLLTVSATEARFSRLREPLSVLSRHLGPAMASPDMLTVVFTYARYMPLAEQQRGIIAAFQEEFNQVLPEALPLTLATSHVSRGRGGVPCVFIETPATMPDCAWKYTAKEQAAARHALNFILARIDASPRTQLPTSRWPPVLAEYEGCDVVYEQGQELRGFLRPVVEYVGLPPHDPDCKWAIDPPLGTLRMSQDPGQLGRLMGAIPEAGCYDVCVTATTTPPDETPSVEAPPSRGPPRRGSIAARSVALHSSRRLQLRIGLTQEALGARLEELLLAVPGPDDRGLLTFVEDSGLPDAAEAAALLRKRLKGRPGLAAPELRALAREVAKQVVRERHETDERISSIMTMVRLRDALRNEQHEEELKMLRQKLTDKNMELEWKTAAWTS